MTRRRRGDSLADPVFASPKPLGAPQIFKPTCRRRRPHHRRRARRAFAAARSSPQLADRDVGGSGGRRGSATTQTRARLDARPRADAPERDHRREATAQVQQAAAWPGVVVGCTAAPANAPASRFRFPARLCAAGPAAQSRGRDAAAPKRTMHTLGSTLTRVPLTCREHFVRTVGHRADAAGESCEKGTIEAAPRCKCAKRAQTILFFRPFRHGRVREALRRHAAPREASATRKLAISLSGPSKLAKPAECLRQLSARSRQAVCRSQKKRPCGRLLKSQKSYASGSATPRSDAYAEQASGQQREHPGFGHAADEIKACCLREVA